MKPKIPFLQLRNYAFTFSAVLIVIGMAVFAWRGKENLGVDFVQGTNINVQIKNDQPIQPGAVREVLARNGFGKAIVQLTSEEDVEMGNRFLIRIAETDIKGRPITPLQGVNEEQGNTVALVASPGSGGSSDDIGSTIQKALASLTATGKPEDIIIEDQQTVGPAVGAQLRTDAIKCIFWSFVFIIIYLWFRFELKFGVAAVIALIHDVLITLGTFAVLRRQIDMGVIAAILTIIGYSLNDTIVVFDRVRENLRLYRGKGYKYIDILNISINETLSRTILTALTTLFTVVVLFIFGGIAIHDFALALLVGIIVGTYSSIFVASPIVLIWQDWSEQRQLRLATQAKKTTSAKKTTQVKAGAKI